MLIKPLFWAQLRALDLDLQPGTREPPGAPISTLRLAHVLVFPADQPPAREVGNTLRTAADSRPRPAVTAATRPVGVPRTAAVPSCALSGAPLPGPAREAPRAGQGRAGGPAPAHRGLRPPACISSRCLWHVTCPGRPGRAISSGL